MKDYISIIVVDNDPEVIKSTLTVLYHEGHSVEGVLSGTEALHKIKQNSYDLVFTDLTLRGIDSITLIKWINQYWPATGIVAITGNHLTKVIKEAYRIGIITHIMKPFTPEMLINASDRALEWLKEHALKNEHEENFRQEMFAELDEVMSQCGNTSSNAIRVLTRAQEIFGYLPLVIQERIAHGLNMSVSEIRSIVLFYSNFRSHPETPHIPAYLNGIQKAWNSVNWMTKENALHSVNEFIKSRQLTSH
ncbi:MAG: response regulator [Nitrospiraceae bacterium]|nr:MAG: response regulator [Nitrospiraceae bacterium]